MATQQDEQATQSTQDTTGSRQTTYGTIPGGIVAGMNPPYIHRDPYARHASMIEFGPDGAPRVVEVVGFPSRYPHILKGYPTRLAEALLGPIETGNVFSVPAPPAPRRGGVAAKQTTAQEQQQQPAPTQEPVQRRPVAEQPVYAIPDIMGEAVGASSVTRSPRGTATAQRLYGGGATSDGANAALEALADMFNYSLDTGNRLVLRERVDYLDEQHRYAPTGYGPAGSLQAAIQHAQAQGVDRSGLIGEIERTPTRSIVATQAGVTNDDVRAQLAAAAASGSPISVETAYERALAQQSGRGQ